MVDEFKKSTIVDLEELIEKRSKEKLSKQLEVNALVDEKEELKLKYITINKSKLIEQLEQVKKDIEKEQEKAMKYWKEGMDSYYEFLKKHVGSTQLGNPPKRPELPKEFEVICGYINMFKCIIKEELFLEFSYLKDMFMKSSEGLNSAIGSTNM